MKNSLVPMTLASLVFGCISNHAPSAIAQLSIQIQTGSVGCPSHSFNALSYTTDEIHTFITRGCRIPRSFYPKNYYPGGCTVLIPGSAVVASSCTIIPQNPAYAYPGGYGGYPSYPTYPGTYSGGVVLPPSPDQHNRVNGIGGFLR